MSSQVDRQIARSQELLDRTARRYRGTARRGRRLARDLLKRLRRTVVAAMLVLVGTIVTALVTPIGLEGVLIAMLLMVACLAFLFIPTLPRIRAEELAQTPLRQLPLRTEIWLENQRRALPAPAVRIADDIGAKLQMLAPQLDRLEDSDPVASDVRRLLSDHLPQLVSGYQTIPQPLRSVERNGRVPDVQLAEGLRVIDDEVARLTERLASGDLDRLAVHNRYLELKYQEAKAIGEG